MSEPIKHDWRGIVQDRIGAAQLPLEPRDEIVSEIAAHLEEMYEATRSSGLDDASAVVLALQEVKDWKALGKRIRRAKKENHPMNHRTKTVWLPGIAILFPIGLLLLRLNRAFVVQQLIWWTCMVMLLCAARSEALNQRTRSVWLPGLISLTAACLFMFAEEILLAHDPSFYFSDISLRPDHLSSALPLWFYLAWLLVQTLCGALAAYLSRRAGGSLRARVIAAAFPAIVMFALWALLIPVSALAEHNIFLFHHPLYYALGVFVWVVPPAMALLSGAAPFLREAEMATCTES